MYRCNFENRNLELRITQPYDLNGITNYAKNITRYCNPITNTAHKFVLSIT